MMGRPRIATRLSIDPEMGVTMLQCSVCHEDKPRDQEQFPDRGPGKPSGVCRGCTNAKKKRYTEEGRVTVQPAARAKAQKRAWAARHREKRLAEARAYKATVRADPAKYARMLENNRMSYRLRREREGKPVKRTPRATMGQCVRDVPSAPIVALIGRTLERRVEIARVLDDPTGATIEAVCADFAVQPRNFRRWRDGTQPSMRIGTAEAILLAADVDWQEVYSYDDHAHIFVGEEAVA